MKFANRHSKRILTDAAGYLLLVAALLTGWLPGPGGIPLAAAGLGLLSIHNTWAKRLRNLVLERGGAITSTLFPKVPWIEWVYDGIALLLLCLTFWLGIRHASIWQVGLAVTTFFIALFIALVNRDRLQRIRGNHKR